MKNKMLITTALVSSVAFSQAVIAETKITGNVETTYSSFSNDLAADQIKSRNGFGMETNIGVAHKKTLSNGMILSAGMNLETGNATTGNGNTTSDVGYVEISSGNTSVHVGQDYGNNLNVIGIPTVGDNYFDVVAGLGGVIAGTTYALGEEAHDALHIGLAQKFSGGVAYVNYAPSSAKNDDSGDSAVVDDGGSKLEFGVKASVAGASIFLAQQTDQQDNEGGSTDDNVQRLYSISYSIDKFSAGVSKRTRDNGEASDSDTDMMSYGVTYSVADNFSLGVQIGNTDKDGQNADEEVQMISAGYNLGGLGIEFSYAQVDNIGGVRGTDGDAFQIRTLAAF
jgi:hypothetical protein